MEELISNVMIDGALAGLLGIIMGIVLLTVLIFYIYTSFCFMKIGQKANDSAPALAWIPLVGPSIIAFRASNMHWWPWLLLYSPLFGHGNYLKK
ncbi:MAG: hypothetical protein ACMXYC_03130 [Candidatus Woesearchaeota archaeon]